jgi:tungstate transport system permease protein
MTTAILLETRRGNFAAAMALGFVLLALAFAVNLVLTRLQQGTDARARNAPWA